MNIELYLRPSKEKDAAQPEPSEVADDDKPPPPLIPLRLPAALLSSLVSNGKNGSSRLVINNPGGGEGGGAVEKINGDGVVEPESLASLTVTQSVAGIKKSCDTTYPLEVIDGKHETTEYYFQSKIARVAGASASASGGSVAGARKELESIGRTNKRYAVKSSKSASFTDLKEIGNKTRRRLEQERKNRKGVVRLDDGECLLPLPKKKKTSAAAARKSPMQLPDDNEKVSPKRKAGIKQPKQKQPKGKRKRKVPSNIDGWMPNVDDLPLSNNDTATITTDDHNDHNSNSNIVRLHGLPLGTKPEHVRKFFHGLNPSLIFALPSSLDNHRIKGWDANMMMGDAGADAVSIVKRHSSDFRVFVKFTSALVAGAAIERSGESIMFDKHCCHPNSLKKEIVGASISLSHVPKHIASFLQKHVAIHAQKGVAIVDTVTKTEQQLGPVKDMVWQMTMKELNLKQNIIIGRGDNRGTPNNTNRQISFDHLRREYTLPTNKFQYQRLVKTYNHLIDTHEKLEMDSGLLLAHTFDPSCLEDSVHRITQSVSNWLLDEIYFIGRLLTESRQRIDL